jgi:hypothetical protein
MFKLFSKKNNNNPCPIEPEMRRWMENSFLWLATQFGHDNVATKPMLLPTPEHFPVRYNGSEESAIQTAKLIAKQMEIDFGEIKLSIFDQSIQEFNGDFGHRMWTVVDESSNEKLAAGLFFDKDEQGRYDIMIERKNLGDPQNLVATLAHEFSHIKLLGEKRLDFNDEYLTDLVPVVFGLGIFNANAAFKEHKSFDSYGHNSIGYLKQKEWGYALALYAFFRNELTPDWVKYLTPNIKADFGKSMDFIRNNTDKVFMEEYTGNPGSDTK